MSGACSTAAATASVPEPTEDTTWMSVWSPSSSSSASRKTWLSSTRTILIGGGTTANLIRLLRPDEERVMRLAALLHVDLDLWMIRPQPLEQQRQVGLLLAGQERHHAARLLEEPVEHRRRDLVEAGAPGHGLPVREA